MSAGESTARMLVLAAASMLPVSIRERYREQWLADLRDAEEVGVSRAEIAFGALAFAAFFDRPSFSPTVVTPGLVTKRSRRWGAIALSSAIVGLVLFTDSLGPVFITRGLTNNFGVDFLQFFVVMLLGLFLALAPVASAIVVWRTRGTDPRVRWGVSLVLVAGIAVATWIALVGTGFHEGWMLVVGFIMVPPVVLAYAGVIAVAAVLIALGLGVGGLSGGTTLRKRLAATALGGTAVWLVVAIGVVNALYWLLLDNREGYSWGVARGSLPAEVQIQGSVWFPGPDYTTTDSAWNIMMELTAGWASGGALVGILLALAGFFGWFTVRRVRLLTLAALSAVVFSNGVLAEFLAMPWAFRFAASGLPYSIPLVLGLIGAITVVQLAINPNPRAHVPLTK